MHLKPSWGSDWDGLYCHHISRTGHSGRLEWISRSRSRPGWFILWFAAFLWPAVASYMQVCLSSCSTQLPLLWYQLWYWYWYWFIYRILPCHLNLSLSFNGKYGKDDHRSDFFKFFKHFFLNTAHFLPFTVSSGGWSWTQQVLPRIWDGWKPLDMQTHTDRHNENTTQKLDFNFQHSSSREWVILFNT